MSQEHSLRTFDEDMDGSLITTWIAKRLNRQPDPLDIYTFGKELYTAGLFQGAARTLQLFLDEIGAEPPGYHLLGYICTSRTYMT